MRRATWDSDGDCEEASAPPMLIQNHTHGALVAGVPSAGVSSTRRTTNDVGVGLGTDQQDTGRSNASPGVTKAASSYYPSVPSVDNSKLPAVYASSAPALCSTASPSLLQHTTMTPGTAARLVGTPDMSLTPATVSFGSSVPGLGVVTAAGLSASLTRTAGTAGVAYAVLPTPPPSVHITSQVAAAHLSAATPPLAAAQLTTPCRGSVAEGAALLSAAAAAAYSSAAGPNCLHPAGGAGAAGLGVAPPSPLDTSRAGDETPTYAAGGLSRRAQEAGASPQAAHVTSAAASHLQHTHGPDSGRQHRMLDDHFEGAPLDEPVLAMPVHSVIADGVPSDGPPFTYLPDPVRRRIRLELGRNAMRNAKTWKDLAMSMSQGGHGGHHWLLWALLFTTAACGIYLFMAGQYPFVAQAQALDMGDLNAMVTLATEEGVKYRYGPPSLGDWLVFWHKRADYSFDFDYLVMWGGKYGPALARGEGWRYLTSLFVHQSAMHLVGNLALFWVLCLYLETMYGTLRVAAVWLTAGVGGALMSTMFENPCTVVIGASGTVFGMLGMYLVDALVNFDSMSVLFLVLRLVGIAACITLLMTVQLVGVAAKATSQASHIGGFVVGAMVALLLLPDLKKRRAAELAKVMRAAGLLHMLPGRYHPVAPQIYSLWQRHGRYIMYVLYSLAAVVLALVFVAAPVYIHTTKLKGVTCATS